MVCSGCQRQDAGASGDQSCRYSERQAESPVCALHRRGRPRDRDQRGEGPPDRPEGPEQALSPLHRLPRRVARGVVHAPVEPQAGTDSGTGHQGHAAQKQDGAPDGNQAEGLSRRQAPPRGAAAGGFGNRITDFGRFPRGVRRRERRMADLVQYYGTGRRKSAIARVFLRPGTGKWKVNGKAFEEYFVTEQQRVAAKRTLVLVEMASSFDVLTTVKSGGVAAQADAVKLGISRALFEFNPELRKVLKAEGLLTRDSRMKERKKYGQKGARARFQFSKR